MAGYLVEEDSVKRMAKVVRAYESGSMGGAYRVPYAPYSSPPPVNVVEVTGAQNVDGTWPGILKFWDNDAKVYTSGDVCYIREINAAALTNGTKYLGRLAGAEPGATSTDPDRLVYLVSASGIVGAILSLDFVTSISCVDGVITPVYSTVCIPGAYICTTTTTTTTTATPTSSTSTSSTSSSSTSSTSSSTTSTTTTCDTMIYGFCVWQWNGSYWSISENHCGPFAGPVNPPNPGATIGETTITCCEPM